MTCLGITGGMRSTSTTALMLLPLHLFINQETRQVANRLLANGCSYIPNRKSYALGPHATVFQSEVYAILACSEYCISEGIINRAISICFDSTAAVLALKSYAVSCCTTVRGLSSGTGSV
jgi:hypothetical protein